jgi:hypothetical protein
MVSQLWVLILIWKGSEKGIAEDFFFPFFPSDPESVNAFWELRIAIKFDFVDSKSL